MPPSHLDDEALSAAVDGVLDAGDDHLRACAACRARRDQLAAARQALRSAPVDPIDELTRRRLLTRALDEAAPVSKPRPWYLRPAVGGVAAALVAVLAAVPLLLDRQDRKTELSATSDSAESAAPFLGDLGDVSDPAALRAALAGRDAAALGASDTAAGGTSAAQTAERNTATDRAAPKSAAPTPAPGAAPAAPTAQPFAARTEAGPRLDPAAVQRCAQVLTTREAKKTRVHATGTGTYRGQPVAIVAVTDDRSGIRTAYVLAPDDCRVLDRHQL